MCDNAVCSFLDPGLIKLYVSDDSHERAICGDARHMPSTPSIDSLVESATHTFREIADS